VSILYSQAKKGVNGLWSSSLLIENEADAEFLSLSAQVCFTCEMVVSRDDDLGKATNYRRWKMTAVADEVMLPHFSTRTVSNEESMPLCLSVVEKG
jgi:hypothetical protein